MAIRERQHLLLLISILVLFTLSPFVVTFRHGALFLNVFGAAVLVAASYALSERRKLFRTAVVLSAISIAATCLLLAFPQHWVVLVSHSSIILLVAFFFVSILAFVLRSGRVTSDKIFAAICVYLQSDLRGLTPTRFLTTCSADRSSLRPKPAKPITSYTSCNSGTSAL
jgi:ABC-type iron transport system FetAB permease component